MDSGVLDTAAGGYKVKRLCAFKNIREHPKVFVAECGDAMLCTHTARMQKR